MKEGFRKIDLVEEKSELVQEIMKRKPSWVVLWGSTFIFGAITAIIFLLWLVRYPDIIVAKITLTNATPPITIISKANGPIVLLVEDNEQIIEGQPIAYIKSPIGFTEVRILSDSVSNLLVDYERLKDPLRTSFLENLSNLGSVQSSFNDFKEQVRKYQFFRNSHPLEKEMMTLKDQIDEYRKIEELVMENAKTLGRQYSLAKKDFDRDLKLFNESVISAKDIENKEKELLTVKSILENAQMKKQEILVSISLLRTSLVRLKNEEERLESELKSGVENTSKKLIADITTWEERYVLKSPSQGAVSFFKFWKNEQFVFEGNEVVSVIPQKESRIIGRVESPLYNSGKIKIGQRVNILLESYPYEEYGPLVGKIESISSLPRRESYMLQVSLNNGLVTTFNKRIDFKQEMIGKAEIVTEDMRLLERVFYQITRGLRMNN